MPQFVALLYLSIKQEVYYTALYYGFEWLIIRLAWLGSASVGITSDRLGRRKAIAFGCIWGAIGGALMAGAAHVAMRKFLLIAWTPHV